MRYDMSDKSLTNTYYTHIRYSDLQLIQYIFVCLPNIKCKRWKLLFSLCLLVLIH